MLLKLLLIFPAVAFAQINIRIKTGGSNEPAGVDVSGSNINLISDVERTTFRINQDPLKEAVRAYEGGWPDDIYVKSPTPWNDLYQTYGWAQIQTVLHPVSAKILGIRSEPSIIGTQEFTNNSTVKATYKADISMDVEDTSSNSWEKGGDLSVGQEINYKIEFGAGEVGGKTSLSYTARWSEVYSKSRTVHVGSSSGVEVVLEPGQEVVAFLSATRGTMDVQIDYVASLVGDVACNYDSVFKGHHFWRYDINEVLKAANLPREIHSREVLNIGFYSNAQVLIRDKVSTRSLLQVDGKIL